MHKRAIARPPQKNHRSPALMSWSDLIAYSSVSHSGFASEQSEAITNTSNAAPTKVIPYSSESNNRRNCHNKRQMGKAVNYAGNNMPPDGMRFQISIVDIKVNPMESIGNTHTQHRFPKEPEFEIG